MGSETDDGLIVLLGVSGWAPREDSGSSADALQAPRPDLGTA